MRRAASAILLIVMLSATISESLSQLRAGDQALYVKRVEIRYYVERPIESAYSSVLRGYCIEESKYVVVEASERSFVIERLVVRVVNRSASDLVCSYLSMIDYGPGGSSRASATLPRATIFFDWDYEYSGPTFTIVRRGGLLLPWVDDVYIYVPPRYLNDVRERETMLGSNETIDGRAFNFYYSVKPIYSRSSGLLERLVCLLAIYADTEPYILIDISVERERDEIVRALLDFAHYLVNLFQRYWRLALAAALSTTAVVLLAKKL